MSASMFFVFCKKFICTNDLQNIIYETWKELSESFVETQDTTWIDIWSKQGDKLLLELWNKKYANYLVENSEAVDSSEEVIEDLDATDSSSLWQKLWNEHTANVYSNHYISFCSAFFHYYTLLKEAASDDEQEYSCALINTINDLSEELVAMGLPRNFTSEKVAELKTSSNIDTKSKAQLSKNSKRRKKQPLCISNDESMQKYWHRRFSLFSRYEQGIQLDRESWFSVTPEKVAKHIAERLSCDVIIDAFCGVGGNTIQFAMTCKHVIAIDIDSAKLKMARENAAIYDVAHKIDFIEGDFLQLCADKNRFVADAVFLSPPWGGPTYKKYGKYDINKFLQPVGASELIDKTRNISPNISLYLPRNANMQQIVALAGSNKQCEIVHNYLDKRLIAVTAFYGDKIISNTNK